MTESQITANQLWTWDFIKSAANQIANIWTDDRSLSAFIWNDARTYSHVTTFREFSGNTSQVSRVSS